MLELDDLLPDAVKHDGIRLDPTKVTIDISGCGYTVEDLQKALFERYNIQVEKSTFNTLTLLLTIGTTRSKVSRLYDALMRIAREGHAPRRLVQTPEIPAFTRLKFLPRDAYYCGGELVPVFDDRERVNRRLAGRIAADQIVPYPPGIPVLVPGQLDHQEDRRLPRRAPALAQAHGDARHRARGLCAVHPRAQARRGKRPAAPLGLNKSSPRRRDPF